MGEDLKSIICLMTANLKFVNMGEDYVALLIICLTLYRGPKIRPTIQR
jgi:hypothetical protein